MVAVFGPSKPYTRKEWTSLCRELDKIPRPLLIVTSTCGGWDRMGREYADSKYLVGMMVLKAKTREMGKEEGIKNCNNTIADLVEEGYTVEGVDTRWSLDMVERLEKRGKRVNYVKVDG